MLSHVPISELIGVPRSDDVIMTSVTSKPTWLQEQMQIIQLLCFAFDKKPLLHYGQHCCSKKRLQCHHLWTTLAFSSSAVPKSAIGTSDGLLESLDAELVCIKPNHLPCAH
jgi:hypothetical protein